MGIFITILLALGLYCLVESHCVGAYAPAAKGILHRAPKKLTQADIIIGRVAETIEPHIAMDPIRRVQLQEQLRNLKRSETPERHQSKIIARALIYAGFMVWTVILSVPIGCGMILAVGVSTYQTETKKLKLEQLAHKNAIERELPQFAGTIQQSLSTTRDIVSILSNYRKICGPVLADEIDRTLNDMISGNASQALKSLEGRVSSPKLSKVTRGLQAVLRGDDKRLYFEMIGADFQKSQNELLERQLLERPKKLYPYLGLLFIALVLMIAASLGADIMHQISNLL